MTRIIIVAVLAVFFGGCSKSQYITKSSSQHTGDVGAFILDSVIAHGGQAKTTNNLPSLQSQWRAEVYVANPENPGTADRKDWETIKIWATGFQQVTGYLATAFGPPALVNSNGITAGFYTQNNIGLSLMFSQDTRKTNEVIVSWSGKTK